jgi:hypothetical protein
MQKMMGEEGVRRLITNSMHLLMDHTSPTQDQPSLSIPALTSGSIGTSPINISPIGEHSEKVTSDLTAVHV